MSPEHDLNLPTATVESTSTDKSAEMPRGVAGEAASVPSSEVASSSTPSVTTAVTSSGAGAAVARAPEVRSADNGTPEQAAATSEPAATSVPAVVAEANSAAEVTEQAGVRRHRGPDCCDSHRWKRLDICGQHVCHRCGDRRCWRIH